MTDRALAERIEEARALLPLLPLRPGYLGDSDEASEITAAVNLLPELLAERDRLLGVVDRLRDLPHGMTESGCTALIPTKQWRELRSALARLDGAE